MTKDRLSELRNINGSVYNDTVEACDSQDTSLSSEVKEVFDEIGKIRKWIDEITDNTSVMKRIHSETTFQTSKNFRDQLDSFITKNNALGLKACGALRQFEDRVQNIDQNNVQARITKLQYATTKQSYSKALANHEEFLQLYRDNQFSLLQEQVKLTNLSITDEECESLLQSNNIALFVDNLEAETKEARLALRDVETRHQELMKIENSLSEVKEMFLQVSLLVSQQQDMLDTVEFYALQATDHVVLGGKQLVSGKKKKRKARKKKIGLFICLATGFLIILIVLILT